MGFLNDLVNGKEKKRKADPLAGTINETAKTGFGYLNAGGSKLNELYNQNPGEFISNQIGLENRLMRSATEDAGRRTQQLLAQRGMGTSSIGLGQEVNQYKNLADRMAMNSASSLNREREMGLENAQGLVNLGNTMAAPKLSQGVQMQDQKYRTGGFGQLIGAGLRAAGTYSGAKAGAKSAKAEG